MTEFARRERCAKTLVPGNAGVLSSRFRMSTVDAGLAYTGSGKMWTSGPMTVREREGP